MDNINKKTLNDVSAPNKIFPSSNSKNVITDNEPAVKDKMLIDDAVASQKSLKHELIIEPVSNLKNKFDSNDVLDPDLDKSENNKEEKEKQSDDVVTTEPLVVSDQKSDTTKIDPTIKQQEEDTLKKYDELIRTKKYFLPINIVQKKKTKRFILIGSLVIIILGLVWLDIALDAGIIHIASIKPLTHFF